MRGTAEVDSPPNGAVREAILYLPEKHASLAERRSDVMSELSGLSGSEGYGIRDDEVGDAKIPSD